MKLLLSLVVIVCGFIVCGLLLVAAPAMAVVIPPSDTLSFTWNGENITRIFAEVPGEAVTEAIDFSFPTPASGFGTQAVTSDFVYLVEPGTVTATNGDGTVTGNRSDQIQLKVSHELGTSTVTVTLLSDEEPGFGNSVTGLLETGLPQDITSMLFGTLLAGSGFTAQVLVTSDGEAAPVPEPATLLLLGSGLVGLAGYGRRRFKK